MDIGMKLITKFNRIILLLSFILFLGFVFLQCSGSKNTVKLQGDIIDESKILHFFSENHDSIFGYSAQSYWWSDTQKYSVVAKNDSGWSFYSLKAYRMKNGKWSKINIKSKILDQKKIRCLMDYWKKIRFFELDNKCLSNKSKRLNDSTFTDLAVNDGVDYRFFILVSGDRKEIQSYSPEIYIDYGISPGCRIRFLNGRDAFLTINP